MLVQGENGKLGWIVSPGFFDRLNAFCYPRTGWLRRAYSYYWAPKSLRPFPLVVFVAIVLAMAISGNGQIGFVVGVIGAAAVDLFVGVLVDRSPLKRADLTDEDYPLLLLYGMFTYEHQSRVIQRELDEYVRQVKRYEIKDIYDENANLVIGVEETELIAVELWRYFKDELGVDIDYKFNLETITEVARAIEASNWREQREKEMESLRIRESDLSGELTEIAARMDWLYDVHVNKESSMAEHAARRIAPE